ncbi:MAG: ABC transporter ATP-binding protein/permease, partial [Chloroflexota bacterium]|nr:ABC transporter ATP-binding protein/permease [Chloroflexota bacterium]
LGVLAVLWTVDWRVSVSLAVFAVFLLAAMLSVRSLATPYWKADRQASAELFGFLEERLSGTVDIRSSGARAYVMRRLAEYQRTRLRTGSRARVVGTTTWSVPVLGFAIGNGLAFGLAAYLHRTESLTLGTAFLIYYYAQMLYFPLNLISWQIEDFQKASAGVIRIHELLNTRSELGVGAETALPTGPLAVELKDVTFAYEEGETVLHDVSFRLEPGGVMGLLGRTGSGKTTITRLIVRLYDVTEGSVQVGDVDVRDAQRAELRRRVGVVTQDVQLFRATVRDNLTFFDSSVHDGRLEAALGELGLLGWLASLPEGLDTVLDAGGGGLSAGEAQLLAFTRVFLKDPGLLILDEASSRLDPATERLIEHAVDRLLQDRTGIIIAHRLSTVQRADQILILEDGHVAEYGGRRQLVSDPGSRFSSLLRTGVEEVLV